MAGLAKAMADRGWIVHYVANESVSAERSKQGWDIPELGNASVHLLEKSSAEHLSLLASLPTDAIHICQGIRSNGYVSKVQRWLGKNGRKYFVIMETVDDAGPLGILKRIAYAAHFKFSIGLEGVLAIGRNTFGWISKLGVPKNKIFEFAYFLPIVNGRIKSENISRTVSEGSKIKFIFIGQLIKRKRLDLLLNSMVSLPKESYTLEVIGSGPLEESLKLQAERLDLGEINWRGVIPIGDIPNILSDVDCLVLPSRHDGWGAVVSEALLSGVRVICSDTCGSSGVALASGVGQVFLSGSQLDLQHALQAMLQDGKVGNHERISTQKWAESTISSVAGAGYLNDILSLSPESGLDTPWVRFSRPDIT